MIIGDQGALVVDSCLLPSSAREDIEQIRHWTTKPVLYLVNTHWHFDHTLGNSTTRSRLPRNTNHCADSCAKTIAAFNPGAVARYPQRAEKFRNILARGRLLTVSP